MNMNDLGNVASIIIAIIALISIFPIFRQLRQNERNVRFQVYRAVMDILENSKPTREKLEILATEDPDFDVLKLKEEDRAEFHDLIRVWDKIAVLVKYGVVPLKFVLDFYSRPIVRSWMYLSPLVYEVRKKRKQPGHRSKFQVLAIKAAEYRRKKYPMEMNFINLDKDFKEWNEWP